MADLEVEIIRARAHYAANRIIEDGVTFHDSHKDFEGLIDRVRAEAKAEALRDAAESNDLIGHMYREYDDHPLRSTLAPANVRATSNYLHNQADQMEGDDAQSST